MALSSICLLNTTTMSYSKNSGYSNRTLTSSGVTFGTSTTRTDSNYGLITVTTSATDGKNLYVIYNMLDNGNNGTLWLSYNTDANTKYYNESNQLRTFTATSGTGGEFSDTYTASGFQKGSGLYYGIMVNGSLEKFSTTYLDSGVSQTAYGPFINVYFAPTIKVTIKSFTIGGRTSSNWDDLPREILVVGSNDKTNWTLINDASYFGQNSPWSSYRDLVTPDGYKDSNNVDIPYNTYTWNITTTSKYSYIRFIIKRLIRGRVLAMYYFNMAYDVYVG